VLLFQLEYCLSSIAEVFALKTKNVLTSAEMTNKILGIIWLFSLGVVIITTVYGVAMSVIQGIEVVGQTFVDVEFPPIHIFPFFYMKPISWLFAAILSLTYCTIELKKESIRNLSPFVKGVTKIVAFMIGILAAYEVLFNFTLWGGLIAADATLGHLNPDLMINPFPNPKIPWNIVFATKIYLATMIVSFYYFLSVNRMQKSDST
jgi:type III secretory pathway component EscS